MSLNYNKIKFTLGLDCIAYQEISDGYVLRYLDTKGNELDLPEIMESHIVETNSQPEWANVG